VAQPVAVQHSIIGRKDEAGAQGPGFRDDGKMFTLDSRGAAHAVAHTVDCRNLCENKDLSGTLQCKQNGGHSLNYQNPVRVGYLVRRLTPLECERLQGFPDNWTNIHDIQLTGRKKCLSSDTARYKALGNSVAIPCVEWIMQRIAEVAT
jgi:DNA (cytosine-5)-methyltransferase 1